MCQAIELEMRRRTPDRQSLNSQRSSQRSSDSATSLDFENARDDDEGVDLDENMLLLLGAMPHVKKKKNSKRRLAAEFTMSNKGGAHF